MARFTYKVKNKDGVTEKGVVEAQNVKQAGVLLHEHGYFIIELKTAQSTVFTPSGAIQSGINLNDLVHFTRQLSTMITAGLTLVESLGILQQQLSKPQLVKLVGQLEESVRGGSSFGAALEKYPKIFPPVYLALVRAGEASGKLDTILSRLSDNLEKTREFRKKVIGTLIYPAIVVSGMVTVAIIVMTVVVPRLTSLYGEFGVELPLPTQILIGVSTFMSNFWWLFIILIVGGGLAFLQWRRTWLGQHVVATLSLSFPVFGPLIRQATIVEMTRTLSILIEGGVPILSALEISKDATGNVLFKEAFISASQKVEKGFPLSAPLSENKLFPPILSQMVAIGEQTGKLGDSLFKLSRYFEAETDSAVRSLTTLIEPLIMVILGVGVGFLVLAVLLPIYSLTSNF